MCSLFHSTRFLVRRGEQVGVAIDRLTSLDRQGERILGPMTNTSSRLYFAFKADRASVLHRHCIGVHRLLPSNTFESCEHSAVIVLVALHGEAALFVAVSPGQANEMFL
jgi:hypothetical protein